MTNDHERSELIWIEEYRRVRHGRIELVRAHWRKLPNRKMRLGIAA